MENELSLSGLTAQVIHSTQLTTIKLNKKYCKEKGTRTHLMIWEGQEGMTVAFQVTLV